MMTLGEIAEKVDARLEGDKNIEINGVATIQTAGPGEISFIANSQYLKYLDRTKASAVVLDLSTECHRTAVLRHSDPYLTFARIVYLFNPDQRHVQPGIHPGTVVEKDAQISSSAGIGPLCHINTGAEIGHDTQIISGCYIGRDVKIGNKCVVYPGVQILAGCIIGNNVTIHAGTAIGSDGFGYAASPDGILKIKQVGWVEIGDDVEIGSNCSIDRGAVGPTKIGKCTKIDNLVHIAHNCEIGQYCFITAQVGFAGSAILGDRIQIGGQAGINGHITIGDDVRIGAKSGIHNSIEPGTTVMGYPARKDSEMKRIWAAESHLPVLLKEFKKIKKRK